MIIDSSAVLAILFDEEDALDYARAIEAAGICRMSAANWLETAIRVDRGGDPIASNAFDDFVHEAGVAVETVTATQAQIARRAYRAYGKGTGHPAGLNFGDCFAYALAKETPRALAVQGGRFCQDRHRTRALSTTADRKAQNRGRSGKRSRPRWMCMRRAEKREGHEQAARADPCCSVRRCFTGTVQGPSAEGQTGYRDAHIKPDWLLIYRVAGDKLSPCGYDERGTAELVIVDPLALCEERFACAALSSSSRESSASLFSLHNLAKSPYVFELVTDTPRADLTWSFSLIVAR